MIQRSNVQRRTREYSAAMNDSSGGDVIAITASKRPSSIRRAKELTSELGMNLAGVEKVFELEQEIDRMRRRMRSLEKQAAKLEQAMAEELDRVRRSFKYELVPYEEPGSALVPAKDLRVAGVRVPISRRPGA